jgi:hypothetical protein
MVVFHSIEIFILLSPHSYFPNHLICQFLLQKMYHFEIFLQKLRNFYILIHFVSTAYRTCTLTFDGPFKKVDLVFSHFLIQRCVVNTEEKRGVLLISVESVQHLDQYGPLQGIHEVFQLDIFFYVKVIDKKIKKNLIKFPFFFLCMMEQPTWVFFE